MPVLLLMERLKVAWVEVVVLVVVVLRERVVFELSELDWMLKTGPSARAKAVLKRLHRLREKIHK